MTINSISGGKSSGYLAVHYPADREVFSMVCLDDASCRIKDPAVLAYAADKLADYVDEFGEVVGTAESDRTLVAMMDLEQYIGRNVTWVRGPSFDELLAGTRTRYGGGSATRLPSWARRYCTVEMKLVPIFLWWYRHIGTEVKMRIGFRADEFRRMLRFMHGAPWRLKFPVSCRLSGERRMVWQDFDWRKIEFPLMEHGIGQENVSTFWQHQGWLGGDLFEGRRKIEFPAVSNCVGCFYKIVEVLAVMAEQEPEKMAWFARQEHNGMGRWLDKKVSYDEIIARPQDFWKEVFYEIASQGETCGSGDCIA